MTFPTLVFGFLLATLYGSLFHFWKGGSLSRLFADIVLSWLGFWGGHAMAAAEGWHWGMVGSLYLGTATLGSAMLLGIGHLLALPGNNHTNSTN